MQRRLVLACMLVATVLLTAGCVAGPMDSGDEPTVTVSDGQPDEAGNGTSTPTESNDTDDAPGVGDAVANYAADRFAVAALAESADGGTLVAGTTGFRAANATILQVGADGTTNWTYEYTSTNRSGIAAIAPASDGGAYAIRTERRVLDNASRPPETSVALVRIGPDGDRQWAESLNTTGYVARGVALAQTDDGVAVAYSRGESGVRLARYDDAGNVTLEHTYGVEATPTALRTTENGFLLAGSVHIDTPWVVRTNETGDPVLNETYDESSAGRVVGVTPTDDGGAILAGWHRAGFGGFNPTPWATRIDGDGVPEWSRVYQTGEQTRVVGVLDTDDGVVLVGSDRAPWGDDSTARFVGVATNGTEQFQTSRAATARVVAVTGSGDGAAVATTHFVERNASSTVLSVDFPDEGAGTTFDAEVTPTSNESVYRGQALGFEYPNATTDTLDLVAVPGEHSDFDRHVERRVALDADGHAVVDSATLSPGKYVVETAAGDVLAVENGLLTPATGNETAAFAVERQDLRVDTNSTYVDATTGDAETTVSIATQRSNYSVYVSADRFRGSVADADVLRDAFADTPGFAGVERVDSRPVARIDLGPTHEVPPTDGYSRWDQKFTLAADAFDAGLYRVRVASVDTRDGGATETTRLVVGKSTAEPLNVTLENDSLTVPVGNESTTNVTVSGLTEGVSAMSMSAQRTGEPAVSLHAHVDIDANRGEGSGSWSDRESTASAAAFGGNTSEGTVTVGELGARARERGVDVDGNATNTVTFGLDWVVDEDGTPYAIPDEQTITVEVTNETAS